MFLGAGIGAEGPRTFHQDLTRIGGEHRHRFRDELLQRHRLLGLAAVHQVGAHARGGHLEHAHARALQQEALRERVGMERGLRRGINRREHQQHEAQDRVRIDDDGIIPLLQTPNQRGTHADRAHEVCGDGIGRQFVVDPSRRFVRQHDAGIVEENVEARICVASAECLLFRSRPRKPAGRISPKAAAPGKASAARPGDDGDHRDKQFPSPQDAWGLQSGCERPDRRSRLAVGRVSVGGKENACILQKCHLVCLTCST